MRKILFGLAPVLLAASGSAMAATPAWKVSEVSGDVRMTENGRAKAAVRGALLASGATIATGPNSRAVIVRGEEFVVISPRTQIRVPAAAAQNKIMQLIEDFGTAVFRINKKSTPHFGVQTPYLAAVVKGTTFTVTVGEQGGSVQVTEGAVQVSTLDGGAADLVLPGAIAQVGASDLYRLTIEGDVTKVIRSDRAPASGTVSASGVIKPVKASYRGPADKQVRIAAAIKEKDRPFEETTKGLVHGKAAAELAQAEFSDQSRGVRNAWGRNKPEEPAKDQPDDKDKPDDGKDKPDDGKDKPADSDKDKPGNGGGDQPGDDGKDKPGSPGGDGKDKPSEGGDDGKGKPDPEDGGKDTPGDGDKGKPGGDDDKDKPGGDDDDGKDKPGGDADKDKPGSGDDDGDGKPGDDD